REFGNRFAQLTVFDAEARHEAEARQGGGAGSVATTLRFLAFLEDDESIKKSQWEGWGEAEFSDLFAQGS
ncbi:hypothetical protein CLOP_g22875, partial [Closterium sp. NIES-67]